MPTPLMMRPMIICGREKALICSTAPTRLRARPSHTALFRPSLSPMVKLARQPKKAPSYVIGEGRRPRA